MAAWDDLAAAPDAHRRDSRLAPGSVQDRDGGCNGQDSKDHHGSPRVGACV